MGTVIINGKQHTNNITKTRLVLIILLAFMYPWISAWVGPGRTRIIVIDAGHGGKDPGALGAHSQEKNINLAIALKTGQYIEKNIDNVKVLYTRSTDVFPELRNRPDFANKNKADLFISIHCNWAKNKNVKGVETYIMGPAKDEQNLEVAMKENEVMLLEDDFSTKYEGFDPKSPESYIMFTVMQSTFQKQSTMLASRIQEQLRNRANRVDRGVQQAGFWVLFNTTMPSVLIETGYITNPDEEKYLCSKNGQDYIASAIYRAVKEYLYDIDKKTSISAINVQQTADQSSDSAVTTSEPIDSSISFMVQIVSSPVRMELNPVNFKGLTDITELPSPEWFRYASGKFRNYPEAVDYRIKLAAIYPDAFVIAVENDKILPLQDALEKTQKK
jgi:N-acetylmuramoyl-L-alanine amidase